MEAMPADAPKALHENAPDDAATVPQRVALAGTRDDGRPGTEKIGRSAADMLRGDMFPPVELIAVCDGDYYPIIDGRHRTAAARPNGPAGTIAALVYTCPLSMEWRAFAEWLEAALEPPDYFADAHLRKAAVRG